MKWLLASVALLALQCHENAGSDDAGPLEAVIMQLTQKVEQLGAKLSAHKSELTELRKFKPSVIFSVQHTGIDFISTDNGTIVFDHVLFNIGGGYSARHGEFTTPVSGLYLVNYRGWIRHQHQAFLLLNLNDRSISELPVGDSSYESASSHSLVVHLQQGDILDITVTTSGPAQMMGEDRTTFMGYLILAD